MGWIADLVNLIEEAPSKAYKTTSAMYLLQADFRIPRRITKDFAVTAMNQNQETENVTGQPTRSPVPEPQPTKPSPADTLADQPLVESLDATIAYLEGLPTGGEVQSAIENIQAWQQKLQSFNKPELTQLAGELGSLIKYLNTPEPDKASISRLLLQIGEHTSQAANEAHSTSKERLISLGNWLKKIGESL